MWSVVSCSGHVRKVNLGIRIVGYREKGTVKGSMTEKEMRGFRKRLVCGMKTK